MNPTLERAGAFLGRGGGASSYLPRPLRVGTVDFGQESCAELGRAERELGVLSGVLRQTPLRRSLIRLIAEREWSAVRGPISAEDRSGGGSEGERFGETVLRVATDPQATPRGGTPIFPDDATHPLRTRPEPWDSGEDEGTRRFYPHPAEVPRLVRQLEVFLAEDRSTPLLAKVALARYQMEVIRPYGNDTRLRAVEVAWRLANEDAFLRPVALPVEEELTGAPRRYADRFRAVWREGDYEGWVRSYVRAVRDGARSVRVGVEESIAGHERLRKTAASLPGRNVLDTLDLFARRSVRTVEEVAEGLNVSFPTANRTVGTLEDAGMVVEVTGRRRNRIFFYEAFAAPILGPSSVVRSPSRSPAPPRRTP